MESDEHAALRANNPFNAKRAALAGHWGWEFAPDAQWLLGRWPVLPVVARWSSHYRAAHADRCYGAVIGAMSGVEFTVFDFQHDLVRGPTAPSWLASSWMNFVTDTVWVVSLPTPMPHVQVLPKKNGYWFLGWKLGRPTTHHAAFNQQHRLVDTDPDVAARVLTPAVVNAAVALDLGTWALIGNDLVYTEASLHGGTPPERIVEVLGKLTAFLAHLPYDVALNP
ncbi:hypothetical protein V5P93_002720 [Actinokineospora auranticolor]|uniref:Uncharacterized protein n=1 Tax=Actinokineospora auranticolor TaxID=155976 RepID=A0A2S6H072_9PSEU|nr:hypothetical protein [Actinokineospora auranticolor]PPK70858.1 hypothetical protein CLV40_10144 [Actinokineospora auranticolor]